MNKLVMCTVFPALLFTSVVVQASPCTETAKEIIGNPSFNITNAKAINDLVKLTKAIGAGQKQNITEKVYTWKTSKGTYSIVVRDGVTIDAEDKGIHPDFGNRKYPSLQQATKQLGTPEEGISKKLVKTWWTCPDTHSMIAVFSDESGKPISFTGRFCPSNVFSEDCAEFGQG